MKFTIALLLCVLILVEEMSAAPTKNKKKSEKNKDKASDKSTNKKKDTTEKEEKKQYIPGMTSTSYGSPDPYGNTYSTGYPSDPYNTGASQFSPQQQQLNEEVFNSPVKLVQIKDLNIKNGVIKQSDVREG